MLHWHVMVLTIFWYSRSLIHKDQNLFLKANSRLTLRALNKVSEIIWSGRKVPQCPAWRARKTIPEETATELKSDTSCNAMQERTLFPFISPTQRTTHPELWTWFFCQEWPPLQYCCWRCRCRSGPCHPRWGQGRSSPGNPHHLPPPWVSVSMSPLGRGCHCQSIWSSVLRGMLHSQARSRLCWQRLWARTVLK